MEQADTYLSTIEKAQTEAWSVQDHINKVISDNSVCAAELEPTISGGKAVADNLSRGFLDVREIVEALKPISDHPAKAQAVNVALSKIPSLRSSYREWAQTSLDHRELVQWRKQ